MQHPRRERRVRHSDRKPKQTLNDFPWDIWLATDRAITRIWIPWHQGHCWCHQSKGSQKIIWKGINSFYRLGASKWNQLPCLKYFHSLSSFILSSKHLGCDSSNKDTGVSFPQANLLGLNFSFVFLPSSLSFFLSFFLSLFFAFLSSIIKWKRCNFAIYILQLYNLSACSTCIEQNWETLIFFIGKNSL